MWSESPSILGLTETWIRPEDSATPAALSSNFSFSHSPRQSGRGQLGNFVDELDVLLSTFPEDGTPLLVFGDFNIHHEKPHATDFTSLLASFDLKRLITTATHKSGNQLDLVYIRNCTTENILVTPLHVSDHFLITFSLQLSTPAPPPPPPVTFRRNLRSLSPSHLSSAVSSSLPPPSQFSSLDVNTATDTLCSTLISSLDIICPLSSRPARATPSNPWLSEVLREHRTELRAAERKWHKSKDASDLSMYQSLLSSFSVDVHAAKSSYFHNKINSSSNTRLLFKTFNSLLCPPPPPPASSLTADDFTTFFTNKTTAISSQFSAPHTQEPRPTPSTANTPLSSFSSLTEEEVSTLLLSSHPTTCPLDPIPSHLLQAISPTLLPSLTHIINSSLHTGTFPTAFKQARVTPLLKKPTLNTSFVENYRPISLLPFIAKTLERAVFNQLTSFLSLNNQLDVNQSGFKKGHSTETALLSVTEALRIAKAASKSSVLILLDLSAAFDTVNHQILLSTLSSLGITGTSLHWFESYLTGRSFKVAWRGEVSRAHQLTTGVPQGSVLGPLLFSIYTTSLGHIIQAHGFSYHCYADDTQLFLSFQPDDPTVAARVSSCLADISTWMKEHHLQLNLAKTELLVLPANPSLQHDFTIQLESSLITPSRSVRNLGVTFDDQLTFTDHISKTARSCRFALHNIRKIRPFLTEHATQLIVQALVISRLDYCNALLAGLPACATKPLQMTQNAAARLVFNEPKRAHVTPLFTSLHWLPLAARIKFKNMQKTDSGLYTAKTIGQKDTIVAEHSVSVIDPVDSPVLNWNAIMISVNSCIVNVSCSGYVLTLSTSYHTNSCREEQVTSTAMQTLTLHCIENIVVCNYSNPVSWKNDTIEINPICTPHEQTLTENPKESNSPLNWHLMIGTIIAVVPLVVLAAVSVICCSYKKHKKGAQEENQTIYAQVQPKIKEQRPLEMLEKSANPQTVYGFTGEYKQTHNTSQNMPSPEPKIKEQRPLEMLEKSANPQTVYGFTGEYKQTHNTSQNMPSPEDRVDFNDETFSLTLKNMQKTDTGLYTARTSGESEKNIVTYKVSVIDAVDAPVLTVNSNWSSSDSCTVNFTCRAHDLMINSSYQNNRCSPQEVTSQINTLILDCSEESIICNHSNTVSWKKDRIDITQLCVNNKVCANPLNQNGTHTPGHSMNDHRTSLQNGHDVDISHKDNDNTTEPQQPLLTDTISAEPCPQSSPQTDILELLQDSAPKDDFLENSQGSQDSISQPPITPEQQPLSPDTFSLSPATPLLCFSQKMEELVHAGTRLSHSFAASPQISTKKRRAPLPPKPAGPAHPPPASVRALRPLPQRQGPHPPPSARDPVDSPVLNWNITMISVNSCIVNVTCSGHDRTISNSYHSNNCSQEEVTSFEMQALTMYCKEDIVICNYSNPVSWKNDTIQIKQLCTPYENKSIEENNSYFPLLWLMVIVISASLMILVATGVLYCFCKNHNKGAQEEIDQTIYAQVQDSDSSPTRPPLDSNLDLDLIGKGLGLNSTKMVLQPEMEVQRPLEMLEKSTTTQTVYRSKHK
ncbi:unnamed protein product [Leuciscus chuanchicus]